jgi:predicted dehydrogenase
VWSEKPMANTYKEGKALLDWRKAKTLEYGVRLLL